MDLDRQRYDTFDELREYCAHVAGAVGVACIGVYGADQPQRAEALGIALQLINIMRDVHEDWELGRVYLPQDELASFGVGEDDIARRRGSPPRGRRSWRTSPPGPGLPRGGSDAARLPRPPQLRLRRHVCRPLPGDAGADRGARLRRLRRAAAPLDADQAPDRRREPAVSLNSRKKVAVVGGGLAGLAAALELRRRRARGRAARGAADARRRRADAARAGGRPAAAARQRPAHRARLLHRVPAVPRADRQGRRDPARAAAAAGDRRARDGSRRSGRGCGCSATRTCRSPRVSGSRRAALRQRGQTPSAVTRTRRLRTLLGATAARDRPLLGRVHPAGAEPPDPRGRRRLRDLHRPDRAARRRPRVATSCSRSSRSARCTATRPAARSATGSASTRGSRASTSSTPTPSIVAVPPPEAARLLGQEPPALEDSPIVSVHLLFDRPILAHRARGAARLARALGLRPRRPHRPRAARRRPVPDGRRERRPRSARGPRQGPRRPDGRRADRAPRPGRAPLVARLPRAARDVRRPARDA